MALLTRGSRCAICSEPLAGSPAMGLRPFVPDTGDPLFRYSDAAMHRACFEKLGPKHPLRLTVEALVGPRHCAVCKRPVSDGMDGFCAGFLTGRPSTRAFRFNFCCVHDSCFESWSDKGALVQALRETVASRPKVYGELKLEKGVPRWRARRRPKLTPANRPDS